MSRENYEQYSLALLEKSEEAYLMALEIVNKPTIKYRTEGFCFFISNAWELLLKAFMIRRSKSIDVIYYGKERKRSLSLSDCIEKVFTSTTDIVKTNLSLVVSIRNRATHTILPDYDYKFVPLFQQNLTNYNKYFTKHFPEYGLNNNVTPFISINRSHKDSNNSSLMIIEDANDFMKKISIAADKDGIGQRVLFSITKKEQEADLKVKLSKDATDKVHIVEKAKDVNGMYTYTYTSAVKTIAETLVISLGANHGFTKRSFNLISNDYPIKTDEKYCYIVPYSKYSVKKYSHEVINFIVYKFTQDKDFRNKYKKKGS